MPKATVQSAMPIHVGEDLTPTETDVALNDLFQTGFFSNVSMYNNNGTLVVKLAERPTIAKVNFTGNELIKKAQLQKVLNQAGLTLGNTFNETILSQLKQSLEQEYIALGKYAVRITTNVKRLPRNRVSIDIKISEGLSAKITRITVVGNHAFDEDTLIDQLTVTTPGIFTFFTGDDKYNHKKLKHRAQ